MLSGPAIPFSLLCSVLCCVCSADPSPGRCSPHCRLQSCEVPGKGDFVSFGAFASTQRLLFPTLAVFRLQGQTWELGGADSTRELTLGVLL